MIEVCNKRGIEARNETKTGTSYSLRRHVCRHGDRIASPHHAAPAFRPPRRNGGRRDTGRIGDLGIEPVASSGQAQERGTRRRGAPRLLFALYREYRNASGTTRLPLRRMLHPKPGSEAGNHRYDRQINKEGVVIMPTESLTDV